MIRHDWPSFSDEGEGGFWFGFVFGGAGFFFLGEIHDTPDSRGA